MIEKILPLRPHHALCLQFFIGKGYGKNFIANMAAVKKHLNQYPDQSILLISGEDSLCSLCPNNQDGVCQTAEKSKRYDRRCLDACGLHIGQILPWRQLNCIMRSSVALSVTARAAICSDCQWDSICREEQRKILSIIQLNHLS
ncbi:MAG: DUF1284 domain-containing protein [Oscillospiraceae bacterium]|jgi:uncharacterized protein